MNVFSNVKIFPGFGGLSALRLPLGQLLLLTCLNSASDLSFELLHLIVYVFIPFIQGVLRKKYANHMKKETLLTF
jgi:hypothetical protein